MRVKRGAALPVMEAPPTEADMPAEDQEPEGLEEVQPEPEAEEPEAEEAEAAPEPEAEAEPEAEPVAE